MQITTPAGTDELDQAVSDSPTGDRASGRRSRRRRFGLGIAAALLATVGAVAVDAAPTKADLIGPMTWGSPQVIDASIVCSPGHLSVSAGTSVQYGYTSGQWVVWRYHLTASNGYAGTSPWSRSNLVPFDSYLIRYLPGAGMAAQTGLRWDVQVQFGYWNGRSYTYSGWVRGGKRQLGYSDWMQNCFT